MLRLPDSGDDNLNLARNWLVQLHHKNNHLGRIQPLIPDYNHSKVSEKNVLDCEYINKTKEDFSPETRPWLIGKEILQNVEI